MSLVLCLDTSTLPLEVSKKVTSLDLLKVSKNNLHLLNRAVVDNKTSDADLEIGKRFRQLIGYTVVKQNGKYLSYARGNGAESRLHSKLSIGVGGHVDFEDYADYHEHECNNPECPFFLQIMSTSILRELEEELGIQHTEVAQFIVGGVLYNNQDAVSSVHLGITSEVVLSPNAKINKTEEIDSHLWVTQEELLRDFDSYETWSQMIISSMLKPS